MKKFSIMVAIVATLTVGYHAADGQGMAVNTTATAADASAMLDVASTSKGVLVPRMTTAQRNAILSPATGLMIYQTDGTAGFYYYTGSAWQAVGGTTLPAGTDGQVLQLVSGVPTWVSTAAKLTTNAITSVNAGARTASCGGNITSDGGAAITARGVCWSNSPDPTADLSTKTVDGTGTGSFTSSLTGLAGTVYVRAYATNSTGTAYGTEFLVTVPITVGASYEGGIVAYLYQSGDPGYVAGVAHGLIVAPSDQSSGIQWYNGVYIATGATATALGTGFANTATIVAAQGAGAYAASICQNYTGGGYYDWYLPSLTELNKIQGLGGYSGTIYWSSSQTASGSGTAYYSPFATGISLPPGYTTELHSVRAVRAF